MKMIEIGRQRSSAARGAPRKHQAFRQLSRATGKQFAIDYARNCRFGGTSGEIHVYDETGANIVETIAVQGGRALGAKEIER